MGAWEQMNWQCEKLEEHSSGYSVNRWLKVLPWSDAQFVSVEAVWLLSGCSAAARWLPAAAASWRCRPGSCLWPQTPATTRCRCPRRCRRRWRRGLAARTALPWWSVMTTMTMMTTTLTPMTMSSMWRDWISRKMLTLVSSIEKWKFFGSSFGFLGSIQT